MKLLNTDSETLQWFPTPMHWNSDAEREEWAEMCALAVLSAHEESPKRRRVKNLRKLLAAFVADLPKLTPAQQAFLFMPDPERTPVPAFVLMAPSEGEAGPALRQIVQADAESAVRPVEVETFTTERLGQGLRSTRFWSTVNGQLMASVRFGWRVAGAGVDLCLYMVWSDPGQMAVYSDTIDEFAGSLWMGDAD
ncbi:hypothetical protein ACIHCM_31015 [Streptomyces sp. NPDC052023]|uniref:hypothetical protein n=1 Tax=Streptomyces sp. NPDC052023 TaxID=3365681 RepID=UPI0037CE9AC6